ncbi:MAG: alpha/beta fold hydrolase [Betaproteobacteria bacterium]
MRFMEDRLTTFTASDQSQRSVHVWSPQAPRAVILGIHGGMAHAGDFVTPALYFRDRGIATVSYDLCGHGKLARVDIPGFYVFLADTELFLAWLKTQYPDQPIFLMGHSMGALIAAHLELGRFAGNPDIKGIILSSPYFVNAVRVPRVLVALSSVLARMFPTAKVPMESLTQSLTHDTAILARHYADEQDNIRASEVSFRFAAALLSAQAALRGELSAWRHPTFAVLAGDDKLANAQAARSMLETMPHQLLELHWHRENYHENFNERNRETTFRDIEVWLEKILASAS